MTMRIGLDLAPRLCVVACLCCVLVACEKKEPSDVNSRLFSTNIHVSIAQHTLVFPFIALDEYAYRHQSFSLDRKGDSERAMGATQKLLQDSADQERPLIVDSLSIVVRTYGWNDSSSISSDEMCKRLSREWARSVCDNPWAAIQQALPANRFRLIDLSRLQIDDPRGLARCIDDGRPRQSLPQRPGDAVMICRAQVSGGDDDEFHLAVVRIDGDLGALWIVWRYGQYGETAEAMTEREGKAIIAFVQYALGSSEDFAGLHDAMCRLRRPGSVDSPEGPDCPNSALPVPARNAN